MNLTPAQRACLETANFHGAAWHQRSIRSRAGGAYARMCKQLAKLGYLEADPPHAITLEGRKVITPPAVLLAQAEEQHARALKAEYARGYAAGQSDAYLNAALRKVCDDIEHYAELPHFGGKTVRYYGWFWRDVTWSGSGCVLTSNHGDADHAGFCVRDKWGYPTKFVTGPAWETIKQAAKAVGDASGVEMPQRLAALNKALSDAWDATP